jgi:hypothetical protein
MLRKWVRSKRFAVRARSTAAVDGISWFFGDTGRALRRRVLMARIGIQRRRQLAEPRRGPGGRRLGRMAAVAAFASVLAAMGLMLSGLGVQEDPRSRASVGGGPGSEGTPPPAVARDGESLRSSVDENEPVGRSVSRRRSSAAPRPRPTPVSKPAPQRRVSSSPRQAPPPDNFSGSQPAPPPPPPPPPQSSPDGGHPHGGPPGQQKPPPGKPESDDDDD